MVYRIIKAYQPQDNNRWRVQAGEEVLYDRRPTDYRGWLWCTNNDGKSAWAPERWVTIISSERCHFIRDYDASELRVDVGQIVEGDIMESGWVLVSDAKKISGWVPLECLESYNDL